MNRTCWTCGFNDSAVPEFLWGEAIIMCLDYELNFSPPTALNRSETPSSILNEKQDTLKLRILGSFMHGIFKVKIKYYNFS